MNILLIDPPYTSLQKFSTTYNYPLGLAYMAAFLNENGHKAMYLNLDFDPSLPALNAFFYKNVMDSYDLYIKETSSDSANVIWSKASEAIKYFKPDLVGISTVSVKMKSVFKLISIIKQIDERIAIVLGGHHSQIFPKEILTNMNQVDFIILGEGEETILELANELGKNNKKFNAIKGLAFKNEIGGIVINEQRPLIENLDMLPYPSFCYYYVGGEFVKIPKNAIIASRGCPYNCNYCATNNIWQKKVRWRSPVNVVDEIKIILSSQKERFLTFYDDCFTLDKKWLLSFCEIIIKEKLEINWQCITSVNLVEEEVFRNIVKAGCIKINIAIESGSDRILTAANKNISLNNVKKTFKLAKKYRISTAAYAMLGFPTETEHDIRLTQKIIRELKPDWVYCNVLITLPGTRYYEWCVERNLIDPTNAWRGDTIKNIIMNITGTMSDEDFFKLTNETFRLCYKVNTNIINLIKRMPIRHYIMNPLKILIDLKRAFEYTRKSKN